MQNIAWHCNKLLKTKSLLTSPSNVLPLFVYFKGRIAPLPNELDPYLQSSPGY